ncbi:MAG TPA: D-alanine--D-alanine ligase [Candidatus Paceibacterota bacterium]|nr:D-alanine--D-alanine ligase [Candidatus Paceibacterota bacterium]
MKKPRIAVLAGGPSSEYEISLRSSAQIERALKAAYPVKRVLLSKEPARLFDTLKKNLKGTDVALLSALHGEWVEDGRLQALLETLRVPYTGSGVLASALGMDKAMSYELAKRFGLLVPPYFVLRRSAEPDVVHARLKEDFGYPCVVKPNALGSSIGVSIVKNRRTLDAALRAAFDYDGTIIVQKFIAGAEVTCGVLGNTARTDLVALPPILIRPPKGAFFDYHAKYDSPKTKELCPAPLPKKTLANIEAAALLAHALHRTDGLTRSDFILDKKGGLNFLEINTAPGMTEASLCPKEARALGWTFLDLLEKIIGLGLERRR